MIDILAIGYMGEDGRVLEMFECLLTMGADLEQVNMNKKTIDDAYEARSNYYSRDPDGLKQLRKFGKLIAQYRLKN